MRLFLGLLMLGMVVACTNITKQDLGLAKRSPDETVVEKKDPLSLPPEFDVRP